MSQPAENNSVKHVLLVPIGSAGDVHPLIGVGRALAARGRKVTIITNGYFEPIVRRAGLGFAELGTVDDYHRTTSDPRLWRQLTAPRALAESLTQAIPEVFEAIRARYSPGRTVVAALGTAFGARIAQEALGVPLATLVLQPAAMRSLHEKPVMHLAMRRTDWMPRWMKRLSYRFQDLVADGVFAPGVNRFRAELGLPPVKHLLVDWWHSPQRIVGLFPPWFAPMQPDWPSQMQLTGFPLFDERDDHPLEQRLESLLAGERPIVFTPGSAYRFGRRFFQASAEACRRLNRPGILLTRHAEQVPKRLPDGVQHFEYVPLSRLLPRCAAIVHHGGIGTMAQAFAAGTPQVVVPFSFDQPDNAVRVRRLGVGAWIAPRRYTAGSAARVLGRLLDDDDVRAACNRFRDQLACESPLEATCDAIESLFGADGSGSMPKLPAEPARADEVLRPAFTAADA
jgi:UDP:flavonoid glycosyltransferase YjiC (YdhE family)